MSRSAEDSEDRGRKTSVFSTFLYLILLILIFLLSDGFSQEKPAPLIVGVEVWADSLAKGENLENLISVKKGDMYSLKAITESLKQIYKTGLFSDIQVLKSGEEQVQLKFMLTRKLLVRKIHFRGNKGISGRRLREALYSLHVDSFFSEEKLNRASEELKRALKQEGYFQPEIDTAAKRNAPAPEIDVTFVIHTGKRFVIEGIHFAGDGVISEKDLKKKMKTREGNLYIPSRLEQDLNRLKDIYVALGYPRAEVELADEKFNKESGRVSLSLNIHPHERINIVIKGAAVPVSLVQPIWEERIFEEWGLSEGEARILSYLRGKGFIFAAVSSSIEKTDSVMRVVHDVSPGQKFKIQDIRFEGISHFNAAQLREQLEIAKPTLFFGAINGERVFELPRDIKSLYESQGFSDVQVDMNFIQEEKKVIAAFYINEGAQQRIDKIAIRGASLFNPETLLSRLSIVEGGPYFPPLIQREIEKLEAFYLDQGIRRTKIEAKTEALNDNHFRVTFEIQEGRKVKIENLVITGNLATRKKTILRELRIKEGDYAFFEKVTASKRNLERLGIFSEVKFEEIPVSPETENLVITLREGEKNYASAGLGLETKDEPFASAISVNDVRLRGTAEFMRSNIFGLAANLSFVSQFSLAEKRAVISWEQPYFLFNFPIETYFNAWIEEEDRQSFGFKREGVSLTGIRSIFYELLMLTTLRYARTTLTYLDISPSEVDRQFYPYSTTSFAPSFIREKRNDVFNPEGGYFGSLALEWAFPLFETESNFLKGVFKYQRFFPIVPRVNLSSTFRLGLGMGKMPIHERFFAGGSNSFRGEKFDELGPKDPASGRPVGGKALILFNFDLTFPVVSGLKNLSGAVFYDAGNVFYNRSDFDLRDLEHALGVGLRYKTPLGPVRFELGWNLSDPERKGKPLVFVTIGNVF
jgi:outer membrane protein assembly complex protein YaeT